MCSLKKYALIGVAALTAFTISCSDKDDDDEGGNGKIVIPDGYAHDKTVTLGGKSSTEGSFLDADGSISVYKIGSVGAQKDNIDLVYDGKNLFVVSYYDTPTGASALGNDKLTPVGATALIWKYTGDEKPESVVDFIKDRYEAGEVDGGATNYAPSAGSKYAVFTTEGVFALVKVGSATEDALKAWVGNFDTE